ncbi:MAG: sulfatase-like hydrolase/transferase [Chloroflexi bacterium]|nr:sulfatase-like hydrolase/transferase [Chloroflexota bacterium]
MKAIMVMFDSLNRRLMEPYGCDWVHTPNFTRLAQRSAAFENAFIGSMPCMPARRELHTGRYNFLHRSWGPLEPFDDSMPQILDENGVHSHKVTDHQHYWEDGGATYHTRFTTHEFNRGQEGDPWKGVVEAGVAAKDADRRSRTRQQDSVNREYINEESLMPQAQTFAKGIEFIRTNAGADNWYLQIETFDPHEPFFTQPGWKELYPHEYDGPLFDWPPYTRITEPPEQVQHMRYEYAALMSMCDHYLGTVLDVMDELSLWDDTLLIVTTDHGFHLGEHDWWGKMRMPWYNELANIPFFVWDPRSKVAGERRSSLAQNIDVPATLLEYFGIDRPKDMQGRPLRDAVADDSPVREAALFGAHGGHVNVTDGRHVYMRAGGDLSTRGTASDDNMPLYNYTLMATHMRHRFQVEELQAIELAPPFSFTKGCPTLKIGAKRAPLWIPFYETLLFDLASDPGQLNPIEDASVETDMIDKLVALMRANDAPSEQYERLGLKA